MITNFKCFRGPFELQLTDGINIIVGDNESGKSTILEAINLALSGWIYGKYVANELSQYLFNRGVVEEYLNKVNNGERAAPPRILIELFFELNDKQLAARFEGNGNSLREKASGIQFQVSFNERYKEHYNILLESDQEISSLPIEYYDFSWSTFARDTLITPRSIPVKSALVDSSNTRLRNGSDLYIARIMRDYMSEEQEIEISQAHREMKEALTSCQAIIDVNKQLKKEELSEKDVRLSANLSARDIWETGVTTYLDEIPFANIGKGEQSLIKTKLALKHEKAQQATTLLLEEPENHLSYGKLHELLKYIDQNREGRQVIVSTHSSFVINKLGMENLILLARGTNLDERHKMRITELTPGTISFFKKLPGYDTLRLILCKQAILVEGPSDELIVQKAYHLRHGNLPIEDGIDVISVGTSFLRFLEIAEKLDKRIIVVTDNDEDVEKVYRKYRDYPDLSLCVDTNEKYKTLEPQIVLANRNSLDNLRQILGLGSSKYPDENHLIDYMLGNKTEVALKLFETEIPFDIPDYIAKAVDACES